MKVFYYKSKNGNFGDDINSWLWDRLLPDFFDNDENTRLSGIGTIIDSYMPQARKWYVLSSGVGYGFPPSHFGKDNWNILCVRGPLSANILNLPPEKFITDGAAFLNKLPEFSPTSEKERKGIIFIPHHYAVHAGEWEKVCKLAGVEFVNPESDSKYVLNKIRNAKLVLADAMHAAIIADAFRVPWVPMVTSPQINTFKWLDWTSTIEQRYTPIVLGSSSLKEMVRSKGLFLHGEKYYNNNCDVESSIKQFKIQRKIKSHTLWPLYRKPASFLANRVAINAASLVEKLDKSLNQKFIDESVKIMISASQQHGFLSDDKIFESNLGRLCDCLYLLKK
ncbi:MULTISPECIES: polysaccharide pyruvyl transferase family protein [Klebsiella pneumoniae complex]|uniref:polysaccharide pyruvyl transferase family protein n=1 Tax=Klebsiella pneumoniae complex TaxID=3390273 RepID=UPI001FB5F783|nr:MULTISPECIES: polysaccharide pyruvyl transferase family protein [Klebsiella]MCJ1810680.1 hypothetical protein [Klebsiella quasipneumoniae subsp. similipneumoniae]